MKDKREREKLIGAQMTLCIIWAALHVRWFICNHRRWHWCCRGCGCIAGGGNRGEVGRGEGGLSSSCCRCQRWCRFVCMSYLPSESSKYFETQPEKPTQPITWMWVLNGYLKCDLYPYPSNQYPHTWRVSKPMTCTTGNKCI